MALGVFDTPLWCLNAKVLQKGSKSLGSRGCFLADNSVKVRFGAGLFKNGYLGGRVFGEFQTTLVKAVGVIPDFNNLD